MMHHKLLGQPTSRQSHVILSAALADLDNDQTEEQPKPIGETTERNDEKSKRTDPPLFVHYTHEKRFETFKRDMHSAYEHVFVNTPAMHAKIVVGNRNRRDTKNEIIRKRPPRTLLQNTMTQSNIYFRHIVHYVLSYPYSSTIQNIHFFLSIL